MKESNEELEVKLNQLLMLLDYYGEEVKKCEKAGAYLSGCIMLGAVLECKLLVWAQIYSDSVETSSSAPRDEQGKLKPPESWTLKELLSVARELNWLPVNKPIPEGVSIKEAFAKANMGDPADRLLEGMKAFSRENIGNLVEIMREVRNCVHPGQYIQTFSESMPKKPLIKDFFKQHYEICSAFANSIGSVFGRHLRLPDSGDIDWPEEERRELCDKLLKDSPHIAELMLREEGTTKVENHDPCLKDIARWYLSDEKKGITPKELRSIVEKHYTDEESKAAFYRFYYITPCGGRKLRELMVAENIVGKWKRSLLADRAWRKRRIPFIDIGKLEFLRDGTVYVDGKKGKYRYKTEEDIPTIYMSVCDTTTKYKIEISKHTLRLVEQGSGRRLPPTSAFCKDEIREYIAQMKNKDKNVRQRTAWALGRMGDKRAVSPLIEALKDEDKEVREEAAEALGHIKDKSAVPALIEARKDEDKKVRDLAAWALGRIGDKRAVPILLEALKDKDKDVRWQAASALGEMGDKTVVRALIEALKDEDKEVREEAAEALGKIKDLRAVGPLIALLKKGEVPSVRESAAEALGEIGNKIAVPVLTKALQDEDENVRKAAKRALEKIKSKQKK